MNQYKHVAFAVAVCAVVATFLPTKAVTKASGPVADQLASASAKDKALVRDFYRAMGDVTRRDQGKQLANTAAWRAAHTSALKLAFGDSGFVGRYPKLDVEVNKILMKALGDKVRPMTDVISPAEDARPVWEVLADACEEVSKQSE